MRYLLKLHQMVENIAISESEINYEDLCLEVPLTAVLLNSTSSTECATKSLLQLWQYDEIQIEQLTDELVLETITEALADNTLGPLEEIQSILSGIEYDPETNQVLKAKGKDLFDRTHNPLHLTLYPDVLKMETIIAVIQKFAKMCKNAICFLFKNP